MPRASMALRGGKRMKKGAISEIHLVCSCDGWPHQAMVLAVYMPPQAPGPGHAFWMMSCRVGSSMRPPNHSP
jgi:hypothetical protein